MRINTLITDIQEYISLLDVSVDEGAIHSGQWCLHVEYPWRFPYLQIQLSDEDQVPHSW